MGVFFSRPGRDENALPYGAYPAGNISSNNSSAIAPYTGLNSGSYEHVSLPNLPPIPFEWIVSPTDVPRSCPDGHQILTWFGVTEAVITILMPLVAYRPLVHHLSRGYLGRRIKLSIWVTWTIPFMCNLIANASIAGLVHDAPGFEKLNMLHIFTVFMCRPRFYFIVLGLLRCVIFVKRPRAWDNTTLIQRKTDDRFEFPFTDAWITTSISETITLIISAIFTSVTWHRLPPASPSRIYTADHVSFIASAPALIFLCMVAFIPVYKRYGEAYPVIRRRYETGLHWGATLSSDGRARIAIKKSAARQAALKRWSSAFVAAVFLGYVTLVQWAYWTRFLDLPGILFCPPKMVGASAIWTVFTLIGILAGAAS